MNAAQRSVLLSAGAVTPRSILGAALVGWWNADSAGKITTTGSGVSSWLDEIGGYDLSQATDAARPVWSPTSFNGRGGVTFDGVDDFLRLGSTPGTFPIGTATSELWLVIDQTVAGSVPGSLSMFGYGSGATNTRLVRRVTGSNVNRAGVNAQGISANNLNVDFSGHHVVRGIFVNGAIEADVDGIVGGSSASALVTAASNVTMGATTATAPTAFMPGVVHQALVINRVVATFEEAALRNYLAARL